MESCVKVTECISYKEIIHRMESGVEVAEYISYIQITIWNAVLKFGNGYFIWRSSYGKLC